MKWMHKLIFVFALITISSVVLFGIYGDTHILAVKSVDYPFYATDDRSQNGLSTSDIRRQGHGVDLKCELKTSDYLWPYCGISVFTDSDSPTQGIDLSAYHTMRIKLRYSPPNTDDGRLRMYLRNYNPAYSDPDIEYTYKYNGIEFDTNGQVQTIEIPLANLHVMTWWLADNQIGIEHSALEYSNVTRIEIATASTTLIGPHNLVIESIEFEGAYFDKEALLLGLLFAWVGLGFAISLFELHKSKKAYQQSQARHEHLTKLNHSLRAQNYEFAELAHRDALTGAMNRHAVQDWLEQQTRQVRWGQGGLVVLFLDLDHFKRVNDEHGHQVGDDILREFVMVVSKSLVNSDRLVRWGGEEFVVFCPDIDISEAIEKAEFIRKNVAKHIWVHGGMLTCSIGVAEMQEERMTETLARADEALYAAKHNGRNRVEVNYGLTKVSA